MEIEEIKKYKVGSELFESKEEAEKFLMFHITTYDKIKGDKTVYTTDDFKNFLFFLFIIYFLAYLIYI